MRIPVIILSFLLTIASPAPVWALEEEPVAKYNEIIDNIYREIWLLKEQYPELSNFSKSAVKTSPEGLKEISFSHEPFSDDDSYGDPYGFRFSVKSNPLTELTDGAAEWKFTSLGFKVVLEIRRPGQLTTFDPFEIVETNVEELYLLEQKILPFQLELSSSKEVYEPKELINLTVTLRNAGDRPFKVFDLNEKSLFCRIDDMTWGNPVPQDTVEKVLPPHGTLTKILRVRGISKPKEARISCRYGIGSKGIQPFNRIKVRIHPAS
jgi:hypothetical protein